MMLKWGDEEIRGGMGGRKYRMQEKKEGKEGERRTKGARKGI